MSTIEKEAQIIIDSIPGLIQAALTGNYVFAGKLAVELAFALVPTTDLKEYLDAKAVELVNKEADALEKAKFGA